MVLGARDFGRTRGTEVDGKLIPTSCHSDWSEAEQRNPFQCSIDSIIYWDNE